MTIDLIDTDYLLIQPNSHLTPGMVQWPMEPGYDAISQLVTPLLDGAQLEHVRVWLTPDYKPNQAGAYTDMFVDDMGLLKGLPINSLATKIYRANILTHDPKLAATMELPFIHGPAVLFSRRVWY